MLPTLLAAAGVPDVKEQLLKGMKVGDKTFKVHLDGYNITDRARRQGPEPAQGVLLLERRRLAGRAALRQLEDRLPGAAQRMASTSGRIRSRRCACPKIFNLRSDPFERADQIGIGYARWRIDRTFLLVPAQQYVGAVHRHVQGIPAEPEGRQLLARSGAGEAHGGEHQRQVTRSAAWQRTHSTAGSQHAAAGHDVAAAVKDFYERYPYPRPIDDLDNYRRRWQDPNRRRADFHLFWPDKPYAEDRTILIAGCGTSQAAKHAARWPAARVIGIDFSATSVRHTEDLKRKYDLTNLEVHQLPIDRVGDLEMTFDEIVCTGVLHHLANPDAALRALRDVLDPDGAMHLMVYAPYGRAGIYMLQEFCRRHRHPGLRRRDPRSHRRARRVAGRTSAGTPAARGPGLPAGGGAGRRAAAPAGPRVFGAAAFRLHRRRRAHVQPLGQAGALQPSLRGHGAAPAGVENRSARTGTSSMPLPNCFAAP